MPLFLTLLAGSSFIVSGAHAGPGDHIRAGDAVITPGLALGAEFHTNPTQSEAGGNAGALLNVRPSLDVAATGNDVEFAFGGHYSARKFFQPSLVAFDRLSDFNVDARLELFKRQVVGFRLSDGMGILGDPNAGLNLGRVLYRYRNNLAGDLVFRAGPTLEISTGGTWAFDQFWNSNGRFNQRNSFGPALIAKWKFFPRTALVLDARYEVNRWSEALLDGQGVTPDIPVNDSEFVKVMGGLSGRLSERVLVVLRVGYGVGLYREGGSINKDLTVNGLQGLLGSAQFRYNFAEGQNFLLGYDKSFADSFFTDSQSYHSIFVRWAGDYGAARKLSTSLEVRPRFESYSGPIERSDLFLTAKADVGYRPQSWLNLMTGVLYAQRASDQASASFNDVTVFLQGSFTY